MESENCPRPQRFVLVQHHFSAAARCADWRLLPVDGIMTHAVGAVRCQEVLISFNWLSHHYKPFDAHCCHTGTATKHPVPDRVKQSFAIFDIRALCRSALGVRVPGCQKITNDSLTRPVWHRLFYSCTDMATVGVKGLIWHNCRRFQGTVTPVLVTM